MEKSFARYCATEMTNKGYKDVKIVDGRDWSKTYATFGVEWRFTNGGIKRAWTIMDLPMDILELESVCNWHDFPANENTHMVRLN